MRLKGVTFFAFMLIVRCLSKYGMALRGRFILHLPTVVSVFMLHAIDATVTCNVLKWWYLNKLDVVVLVGPKILYRIVKELCFLIS